MENNRKEQMEALKVLVIDRRAENFQERGRISC